MIQRKWWRFWKAEHVRSNARPTGCDETQAAEKPERFDRTVIACDLTFGSIDGDYAVAQVWGARHGGRYLLEQWRKRAGFEDQLAAIVALARRYPGATVLVEKAANGAAVIEKLRHDLPAVLAVKPQGTKVQRLSAAAPQIEAGSCYLPLGANWLDEFVDELSVFPNGAHDDMVDCAAYALQYLTQQAVLDDAPAAPRIIRLR